mmetsp:Transcript_9509/g.23326  ORF Transcript_9509/g.23326 Transcript_9509/m.23326 type:complete len:206 (-) Transcript_9509:666-1283(-)
MALACSARTDTCWTVLSQSYRSPTKLSSHSALSCLNLSLSFFNVPIVSSNFCSYVRRCVCTCCSYSRAAARRSSDCAITTAIWSLSISSCALCVSYFVLLSCSNDFNLSIVSFWLAIVAVAVAWNSFATILSSKRVLSAASRSTVMSLTLLFRADTPLATSMSVLFVCASASFRALLDDRSRVLSICRILLFSSSFSSSSLSTTT